MKHEFTLLLINLIFVGITALKCDNSIILDLTAQNLTELENFEECENLSALIVKNNALHNLPEDIFSNLTNLKVLDLSYNKFTVISALVFVKLINLTHLNIGGNSLEELDFLVNVTSLAFLNASHNRLSSLVTPTGCMFLQVVDLSYNEITEYRDEYLNCNHLLELDLSHNKLKSSGMGDTKHIALHLRKVDFSYNDITETEFDDFFFLAENVSFNLQNNRISYINMYSLSAENNSGGSPTRTHVSLENNPIDCQNCSVYGLVKYFNDKLKEEYRNTAQIESKNFRCAQSTLVSSLKVETFSCEVNIRCPEGCNCIQRLFDSTLIVDCSGKGLKRVPVLNNFRTQKFMQIDVHLENNQLTEGPSYDMGYENITNLFINDNKLEKLTWMPFYLHSIMLHNNLLTSLPYETLMYLNHSIYLQKMSLHGNPWTCSCDIVNFTNFIRQHNKQILNGMDILCQDRATLLVNVNESTACENYAVITLTVSIILVALILALAILTTVYYKYKYNIKAWLYSHGLCLRWLLVQDEDRGKLYDAFVSYSEADEEFVMKNLVAILENGPERFKMCLQFREGTAGDTRLDSVAELIEKSKRTLVLLSKSFLEDVWTLHEFRTAHLNAMSDPLKKVVVIIYGNVDLKSLDDELDAYLKTNTYVEWGDPWFWNKIRYALPHMKEFRRKKAQKTIENIEKMELGSATIANNGFCHSENSLLKTAAQNE